MKFYCKNCECVLELSEKAELLLRQAAIDEDSLGHWDRETLLCDICSGESQEVWMKRIPDYETPEQYEKRTGKPWPDNAPVWYRYRNNGTDWSEWNLSTLKFIKFTKKNLLMIHIQRVCANSRNGYPPPDYWRL